MIITLATHHIKVLNLKPLFTILRAAFDLEQTDKLKTHISTSGGCGLQFQMQNA